MDRPDWPDNMRPSPGGLLTGWPRKGLHDDMRPFAFHDATDFGIPPRAGLLGKAEIRSFRVFEQGQGASARRLADSTRQQSARPFAYLAVRAGEVISKKELIDHVWPGVAVEEGSLRVHVAAIRKAFRDGQFGTRYIADVRGRGYSFVSRVARLDDGNESKPQ